MGVIRGLTRPLPVPGPLGVPGPYQVFPGTRLKTAHYRFRRKMWDEIQQSPGELSTLLEIFNRTSAIPHLEPQSQSVRSRDIGAMFPFCTFGSKHSSKALKERCYLFRRPKVTSNPQEACFTFNGNDLGAPSASGQSSM